jgi:hypothetical protein
MGEGFNFDEDGGAEQGAEATCIGVNPTISPRTAPAPRHQPEADRKSVV